MKIGITGSRGFIGSKITPILSKDYETIHLGQQEKLDITDRDSIDKSIADTEADIILHLAAYTNVDESENQKNDGEKSTAWKTNVLGTENVANSSRKNGKKLIYISTDMVFGGNYEDWYHEYSTPSPVNFYGTTKYQGELRIENSGVDAAILRIAYPYTWKAEKKDFARAFINLFKDNKKFSSVDDAFFSPTYIDDIATSIKLIIDEQLTGVIHGASGEKWSGYELALKIADKFNFDKSLVSKTSRNEFFKSRAPRSKNTSLYNDTLNKKGIKLHSFDEALNEVPEELLTLSS